MMRDVALDPIRRPDHREQSREILLALSVDSVVAAIFAEGLSERAKVEVPRLRERRRMR